MEGTALLVTISEDLSNEPVLKVWALDKADKKTGAPKCLSSLGIHNGRKQFPVSHALSKLRFSVSMGLTKTDFGLRNTREPVSTCGRVRKWRGYCDKRRLDTRPRRQAKNCL